MENLLAILNAVALIVAGASILANFTKTDADNAVLAKVSKLVNVLALNFKK